MHTISSFIVKVIVRFVDEFRWAGILFLILLVEGVCIFFYCEEKIEKVDITGEPLLITDISCSSGTNSEGEKGYDLTLTLENNGSRRAIFSGDLLYNDRGYTIKNEPGYLYHNIDDWGSLYDGVIVPPGSEAVTTVFISSRTLDVEDSENIIFQTELDGATVAFPMEELQ